MTNNFMIAYQGSEGSYSEELLKKEFSNYSFIACESFTELLNKVSSENCLGLLPVENSIAGTVNEAYEELINSGLEIFGEYIKKINHTLIGLSNSKFEEITHVISHPQALQQCSKFLQDSKLRITPVFDTAGSVFEILETKDINTAAIAGEHFKNDERFKILKENISNHQENFTRFLLIGNEKLESNKENNKYSSVLVSDDKPGSLLKALNIFSDLNINLTKLESRPILGRPWEYKFYIDYELQNVKTQTDLIDGIKKVSKEFIILGHYPKANP